MPVTHTLYIAEIPFESGEVQFRYSRYMSDDGSRWIRHGLFCAYEKDGTLRSEGNYDHGVETGIWSDYHGNGQIAARGEYVQGKQHGHWRFWDPQGTEELSTEFNDGEVVA